MNQKLLLRVRSAILAHPDQFDMSGYFNTCLWFGVNKQPAGGCGTAACIAGWTAFLTRKSRTLDAANRVVGDTHSEAVAALDITGEESLRLFYSAQWPKQFRTRYNKATTVKQRARAAADRISWFIKTKGAE